MPPHFSASSGVRVISLHMRETLKLFHCSASKLHRKTTIMSLPQCIITNVHYSNKINPSCQTSAATHDVQRLTFKLSWTNFPLFSKSEHTSQNFRFTLLCKLQRTWPLCPQPVQSVSQCICCNEAPHKNTENIVCFHYWAHSSFGCSQFCLFWNCQAHGHSRVQVCVCVCDIVGSVVWMHANLTTANSAGFLVYEKWVLVWNERDATVKP